MIQDLLFLFGCIPEITSNCQDMTNASSTYLGIVVGAIIGGIITWWIYNCQKRTSEIQELTLNKIKAFDESHDLILKRVESLNVRHEEMLNKILELAEKIDSLENQTSVNSKSIT